MTDAIILHASLRQPLSCPHWQEPLLQALPYAHRLELERREPQARRASLAGLGLVLLATARISGHESAPRALTFPRDGKPWLEGGPSFSVSHSPSCVACVVCAASDCGIDIEDVPQLTEPAAAAKILRWTATEAALKAAGLGVRALDRVVLTESLGAAVIGNDRYELQEVKVAPGTVGHIAAKMLPTAVVECVELDDARLSALLQRSFGLAAQIE